MKLYKPKEGEIVYYNDIKYTVKYANNDYIRIENEGDVDSEYVLFWMVDNIRKIRKKKLDRVKETKEINYLEKYNH